MTAVILAGGKNSRIGRNKAFLQIGDNTFIERIVAKLKSLFENIIIVTNTPTDYEFPGIKLIKDIIPDKGPLGGIYSGLNFSSDFYNFFVACDMPFLNLDFIDYMCNRVEGYDLVIPYVNGRYEPLHAIYSKNCSVPIKMQLKENNLKITDFFNQVKINKINEQEISRFDPEFQSFININTIKDFENKIEK
ncbi:putative molybdenum cofactor guanylyltransferase [bacterium BMS3Bbin03]|nr:putative molybdenum cofactor guanylyltransferase [bacterium BMS3Bbin03]